MPSIRSRSDGSLTLRPNIPAAGATLTTNSFDILGGDPGAVVGVIPNEKIDLFMGLPALPNNTSTADSVTITLVDSADGVTFAPVASIAPLVVAGVAGTGSLAASRQFPIPPAIRRYAAVTIVATAGAGNNTAQQATFQQRF